MNRKTVLLALMILCLSIILPGCDGEEIISYLLTVERTGTGDVIPQVGQHTINKDTFVNLQASRVSFAWDFHEWIGDVPEPNSKATVIYMNEDKTVDVVFNKVKTRDSITRDDLTNMEGNMTDDLLWWTEISKNILYFYKTAQGHFGKIVFHEIDFDSPCGLEISFITFKNDGEVLITKDNVYIGLTKLFDLDTGEILEENNGEVDFSLLYSGHPDSDIFAPYLKPENGAIYWKFVLFIP